MQYQVSKQRSNYEIHSPILPRQLTHYLRLHQKRVRQVWKYGKSRPARQEHPGMPPVLIKCRAELLGQE
jgi:hypothetical protein